MTADDIIANIQASPKYSVLDRRVIARVVGDSVRRFGLKRAAAESKRLLHQIWALYYADAKLKPMEASSTELLQLHQSTRERLPILHNFYEQIFSITGQPRAIADYACGLNPLAFCMLGYAFPEHYHAFDIDTFTVDTLNRAFAGLGVTGRFSARLGDLLLDEPVAADVAFLLKVLPCLELQQKGSSKMVLGRQVSRFVVVSYPIKSVSGREKGMLDFYRQQFRQAVDSAWQVHELVFASELVFVIDKFKKVD